MADPCDADFSVLRGVWDRRALLAVSLLEDLGKQSVPQEVIVPPRPSLFREDASVVGADGFFCWVGGWAGSAFWHG